MKAKQVLFQVQQNYLNDKLNKDIQDILEKLDIHANLETTINALKKEYVLTKLEAVAYSFNPYKYKIHSVILKDRVYYIEAEMVGSLTVLEKKPIKWKQNQIASNLSSNFYIQEKKTVLIPVQISNAGFEESSLIEATIFAKKFFEETLELLNEEILSYNSKMISFLEEKLPSKFEDKKILVDSLKEHNIRVI